MLLFQDHDFNALKYLEWIQSNFNTSTIRVTFILRGNEIEIEVEVVQFAIVKQF